MVESNNKELFYNDEVLKGILKTINGNILIKALEDYAENEKSKIFKNTNNNEDIIKYLNMYKGYENIINFLKEYQN